MKYQYEDEILNELYASMFGEEGEEAQAAATDGGQETPDPNAQDVDGSAKEFHAALKPLLKQFEDVFKEYIDNPEVIEATKKLFTGSDLISDFGRRALVFLTKTNK